MEESESPTIRSIQERVSLHAAATWPDMTIEIETLALAEEVGEMCRAVVKRHHGTRGSAEEWTAELRKEMGDVMLVLCNLATIEGFDLGDAVAERVDVVTSRDVNHDPVGS